MALDLEGRTRARCDFKDCPFDAKVIDLSAGSFVTEGDKVFHASCYAAAKGAPAESATRKAKRDADAALEAERVAVVQKREADALAASRAAAEQLSGQVPTGSAVAGTPGHVDPQTGRVAPLITDSVAQPAIRG